MVIVVGSGMAKKVGKRGKSSIGFLLVKLELELELELAGYVRLILTKNPKPHQNHNFVVVYRSSKSLLVIAGLVVASFTVRVGHVSVMVTGFFFVVSKIVLVSLASASLVTV